MERPKLGLIVREPYASLIVDGKKTWEIRKRRARHRGPLGIVTGGWLIGQADLVGVEGPFSVKGLLAHREKHRAENAFRYEKPRASLLNSVRSLTLSPGLSHLATSPVMRKVTPPSRRTSPYQRQ